MDSSVGGGGDNASITRWVNMCVGEIRVGKWRWWDEREREKCGFCAQHSWEGEIEEEEGGDKGGKRQVFKSF